MNKIKRKLSLCLAASLFFQVHTIHNLYAKDEKSEQITVTYSSYNDLDLVYSLTDMTTAKNLTFDSTEKVDLTDAVPIVIDPSIRYQEWQGFGGSIEGATVYKYNQLSTKDQQNLLRDLYDQDYGNNYNLIRVCIGASDFTIDAIEAGSYGPYDETAGSGYWTYNDIVDEDTNNDGILDADTDLSNFTIEKDIENGTIGMLQDILEVNPDVKFFASMWSAPAWMKKNESIIWEEGQPEPEIKEEYYEVLAEYYCKFIEAYAEHGIEISAVTLQNEPDIKIGYPCTVFTPENQIRFATLLGEAFEAHHLDVEIWGLDSNEFRTWEYGVPLLQSEAEQYIDGIGFHNYGGITMHYPDTLREQFPDKSFHITEMTAGADKIIEYMRNWINSYAYWITYYDVDMENHTYGPGPSFWSKPQSEDADHWSLAQVSDNGYGSYQLNSKYYVFGQFSRAIDVGAVRVASSENNGNISNVAFYNPDGTMSIIVSNRITSPNTNYDPNTPDQKITIITPEGSFTDTLPGDTVATYTWKMDLGELKNNDSWSLSVPSVHRGFSSYQAIDNSYESLWTSGQDQTTGQAIILDLGSNTKFTQISMMTDGYFIKDQPGTCTVSLSHNGVVWKESITTQGGIGFTNIQFDSEETARYIMIELQSSEPKWWTIQQISLYNKNNTEIPKSNTRDNMIEDKSSWKVEASNNRVTESYAKQVIDNNPFTSYIYRGPQTEGFFIEVDMAEIYSFDKVIVDSGTSNDYARAFRLAWSEDGLTWYDNGEKIKTDIIYEGSDIVSTSTEVLLEDTINARYIRVIIDEEVGDHWWEVVEIDVLTSEPLSYINYLDRTGWYSVSEIFDWSDLNNNMFDGNDSTRFSNLKKQETGDSVNIELTDIQAFDYIEMDCGTDYPRGYKLLYSIDGINYTEIYNGVGESGTTIIELDETLYAKNLRIELTEDYETAYWSIYELRLGYEDVSEEGTPLVKNQWDAYTSLHGIHVESNVIDGDLNSLWQSNEVQTATSDYATSMLLDMGQDEWITGVSINSGQDMWSYIEHYQIYAWSQGETPQLVAEGFGREAVTRIYIEPMQAQYVWIKAGSSSHDRTFSIAELNIYTSEVTKKVIPQQSGNKKGLQNGPSTQKKQ